MDLNRAAIFVRVVEHGGFTAAARVLGLPKSSVSRAVAKLEEELGVRLLARSTRAVRMTEAGSAFYDRASRGIAGVEEAAAAVVDMQSAVRGPIRITAPVDLGVFLLEPLIARFVAQHPDVHVDVVLTGRTVDLVEEGFDFAVRAGVLRDASLIARKLPTFEMTLQATPDYLARRGRPATVAELAEHDCVVFRPTQRRTTWTLTSDAGIESVEVTGRVSTDDFAFIRAAVLSGVGIALLPSFLTESAEEAGLLVRVLPGHHVAGAPLNLVYPSSRYVPHRVAVFRDFLAQELGSRAAPAAGLRGLPPATLGKRGKRGKPGQRP